MIRLAGLELHGMANLQFLLRWTV